MNTLEKRMQITINKNFWENATTGEWTAAKCCAIVAVDFLKGWHNWVIENKYWQIIDPNSNGYLMWGNMDDDCEIINTDQLINLYINKLTN